MDEMLDNEVGYYEVEGADERLSVRYWNGFDWFFVRGGYPTILANDEKARPICPPERVREALLNARAAKVFVEDRLRLIEAVQAMREDTRERVPTPDGDEIIWAEGAEYAFLRVLDELGAPQSE